MSVHIVLTTYNIQLNNINKYENWLFLFLLLLISGVWYLQCNKCLSWTYNQLKLLKSSAVSILLSQTSPVQSLCRMTLTWIDSFPWTWFSEDTTKAVHFFRVLDCLQDLLLSWLFVCDRGRSERQIIWQALLKFDHLWE